MEEKKHLIDFMRCHKLMQLATVSKKPWICTLYYAIDAKMNIYFISDPGTKHCIDIKNNMNVACAIADSYQKPVDRKLGVQIAGTAKQVSNNMEIEHALKLWNNANPGMNKFINIKNFRNGTMQEKLYVIKPKKAKFFNEKLYGPEGFIIYNF
jgi:uncharacterized protein YhbP (UPF0306 family)